MKTQKTIITLSVLTALGLIVGCEKKPETQVNESAVSAPEKAASTPAPAEVSKAVEAAKPAAEQAATEVKAAAAATTTATTTAAADATAKFNAVVDQAKSLMGQSKYSDALNTLQQVANLKLTPEQDKIVASLKEQIQKAMAAKATTDAAGAAGNLLK